MEPTVIRVAIVDDHPVARWGIEHLFEAYDHIQVVSSVAAVEELDAAPQVVILDLYLRGGRPALAAIEALASCCRVLVMSASGRLDDVLAAIRAGASGYLTKDASEEAFVSETPPPARPVGRRLRGRRRRSTGGDAADGCGTGRERSAAVQHVTTPPESAADHGSVVDHFEDPGQPGRDRKSRLSARGLARVSNVDGLGSSGRPD